MSDTVVYTAIFGGRDALRAIPGEPGVRYVCFTDNPRLCREPWEVVACEREYKYPRLDAKRFKVRPHRFLPQAARSIYLDGHIVPRVPIVPMLDEVAHLGLFAHPARRCAYSEGRFVAARKRKDTPGQVQRTLEWLHAQRFPRRAGLYMGGVIFRVHGPDVTRFNELWWEALQVGTYRDQITLPWAIRESGVGVKKWPSKTRRACIRVHRHRRGTGAGRGSGLAGSLLPAADAREPCT